MYDPAFSESNQHPITPASLPGVLVANHFCASFGYHVRRPTGTRDWLVTFTISGIGCYRLSDQTHLCRAGDVMMLEPGVMHDYATLDQSQPWEFYWAHFIPRAHWTEWMKFSQQSEGLRNVTILDSVLRQRIEHTFERLLQDLRNSTRLHADLAANSLEEILICIALHNHETQTQSLDPRIDAILKFLNANYQEPVTIDQLAQQVSLSASRLAHLFKAHMGRSIVDMILAIRLHQAAHLLSYTSLQIGEIAQEVGFQSASYLSRRFTLYYGTSPQSYRRHLQENPSKRDK